MNSFCSLDANCSVFDRATKLPGIARTSEICQGCVNRSRRELGMLRYDYVDLSQLIVPADSRSDAHIFRPKPESSPPIDLHAFTLRSQIAEAVVATEEAVRRLAGYRANCAPTREGWAVDHAVRFLSERIDSIASVRSVFYGPESDADGLTMLLEFGGLHRAAQRVVGLLAPTVGLPGDCPKCAVPALRRRADVENHVWCAHCHLSMTRVDYYRACQMQFAPVTGAQPGRSAE
jgi:hypothetical protein